MLEAKTEYMNIKMEIEYSMCAFSYLLQDNYQFSVLRIILLPDQTWTRLTDTAWND